MSWFEDRPEVSIALIEGATTARGGNEPKPNHTHSFDVGAAWQTLALQAWHMGYAAHGMSGVDFERAATELGVPDDYRIEAAIALGRPAPADRLPDFLREREVISGRKPVAEIMRAGGFA